MNVIRAEALGMCFGVRDALAATRQVAEPPSVTIHGELVHNPTVLIELETRGFPMLPEDGREGIPDTPNVLITAHGISDIERDRLQNAGKRLIDTTCPLVRRVHQAARTLANEGYHVIVIGRPGHVEVRGIVEDLPHYDVVPSPGCVRPYAARRLGLVCQSTTPPKLAEAVREAIVRENPHAEVRFLDTICQPTRDRQSAVERLLPQVDAMVIVGGANSNNTRELVARCRERGLTTLHVQSASDLDPESLRGCQTVGLTAGTSTLDATIEEVYEALCQIAS